MSMSRTMFVRGVLVLLLGAAVAFAQSPEEFRGRIIDNIETKGNTSLEASKILSRVRSRSGEGFDPKTASGDAERIAELTSVEYSYYNIEEVEGEVVLTFVVVERGLIRSVKFTGNSAFRDIALRKKSGLAVGNYLDPVMAEAGRSDVEEYYHEKGYAFAKVEMDGKYMKVGKVIYRVFEGPRVRITSVTFEGNEIFGTRKLKLVAKTRSRKFLLWPAYYSKEKLDKDLLKLRKAYQKRGYLDSNIKAEPTFDRLRSSVSIVFTISEGAIYSIGKINFVGVTEYKVSELRKDLKLKSGMIYNEEHAKADTKRILKTYQEEGFLGAAVERKKRFSSGNKIDIDFIITESERFRIGQIKITGNEGIQDKVIRRILNEYEFTPGSWYNGDQARGDGKGPLEKIVKRTVLAESATITAIGEKPGQRDAYVDIIEGRTGSLMLGAGLASDSGVIGQFVFEQQNFDIGNPPEDWKDFFTGKAFRGAGQTLRISLEPGTEVSQYSVTFTEPYFQDRPISLDVASSSYERGRESYNEGRIRGYVGFEKRYKSKWYRGIGFRIEEVDIDSIDVDAPQEVIDDKGSNVIGGVRFGIGKDATDNRYNPSKGYTLNAYAEPVFGDYGFINMGITYRRYRTLHEDLAERKTILATKLHGGVIGGNAPVFEKFYAGGSSNMRGFEYRGISKRGLQTGVPTPVKKDQIGSDWIFLANGEVTVPVLEESISALFFIDSGMIETGGYRAAIGTGVQIMIPQWLGPVPMRFEIALPVMKDDLDDTKTFSFSMGKLF
ncbi:MAG: outer membrane protein assembly factor BamA [Planctomycetes bacterium]|nr:outer membrane protein assembly factor BamA [Planctomycetota bacterium]